VRYELARACGRIRAESPLVAGKFLQKPASKSLLEMLKNNNKCYRKFSALPQKIFLQKSARKVCNNDLSKSVKVLKSS
jgi:hypothetical protein